MKEMTAQHFRKKEEKSAYEDPTADTVLNLIPLPLLYLCIPYHGDLDQYYRETLRWYSMAEDEGFIPISPLFCIPQLVEKHAPGLQKISKALNYDLLRICKKAWLCGNIENEAMGSEVSQAIRLHIPVDHLSEVTQ